MALGASIAGARSIVCMKHVGLNVAADPLFTSAYTGINGGLVIVVADDPGMHSSQNEQDSRFYAKAAHIPMMEPSDSKEARDFTKLAFDISEKYDTPVMIRMATRISHSQSPVEPEDRISVSIKDYKKNVSKYVMMPGMARGRRKVLVERMKELFKYSENIGINKIESGDLRVGIIAGGELIIMQRKRSPEPRF